MEAPLTGREGTAVKAPLSVIIPTLNESAGIGDCVASLGWADQIIVVDAGSTDETAARARSAGATVLEHRGGTIAGQRNHGIASARNQWIFALDADERISEELQAELVQVTSNPAHAAYAVRRRNFYLGRELKRGHWGRDWVVRLFRKDRRFVDQRVHEHLEPVADLGHLSGTLAHQPYRDLTHHLEKMPRYARWGAEDLYQRGRRAGTADLLLRPLWRFIRAYLLEAAILDGRFGLVVSALDAHSAFLKYAYLWRLEQSNRSGEGSGR